MSCDAVAFAATLWLSSFDPSAQALGAQPAMFLRTANAPPPRVGNEPMYRDIVKQAKSLKGEVDAYLQGRRENRRRPTRPGPSSTSTPSSRRSAPCRSST